MDTTQAIRTPKPATMPKYSAKLAIRKDRVNAKGEVSVFLDVRLTGKRTRLDLGQKVPLKNWNEQKQRIKVGYTLDAEAADDLNYILQAQLNKVAAIFRTYRIKERELTASQLKRELEQGESKDCFHTWVQDKIKELEGVRGKRTIDHYRVTFRRLKEFRPELSFYDLSPELPVEFDNWLIKEKQLSALNTRAKYHKHLKTFTRMLERSEGANVPNVYKYFKIKQVRSKRTFLSKQEVAKLVELFEAGQLSPHIHKALQRFLFSCHCGGLRCSDLNNISWDDYEDGYLCFFPEKTQHIDKLIEVPLTKAAMRFVQHPKGNLFDKLSNQKYNEYLKVVQRVSGITKTLTTHVARHTFATNYLVAGGRREVLQRILGHTDPETTEIYVHTSRQHVNDELHVLGKMY